jgi:ABC-type branched-subunit amino acid transport system ATPase component
VIQIESVDIREFRGIRDLRLEMKRGSFVVSGPNGSGKSGVVDAIQFALTGKIGRLVGSGAGDLRLSDHGPHVDMRSYPDAASVRMDVYIPHLKKSASIMRTIKKAKHPQITPDEDAVKIVFAELAQHPEITLARREIIKFILTEATQRSREVQTLLQLDDIDETRATLKTTENKLNAEHSIAKAQADAEEGSLKRHLDLATLKAEDLLAVVNRRRKILNLPPIEALTKDNSLSEGIAGGAGEGGGEQSKESALGDLKALADAVGQGFETSTESTISVLLQSIATLEANPGLLEAIRKHSFLQAGLDMVDSAHCPLCDTEWNIDALRSYLKEKLEESKSAQVVRNLLIDSAQTIAMEVVRLRGLIEPLTKLREIDMEFVRLLSGWSGGLLSFSKSLSSVEGTLAEKERLETGWAAAPATLMAALEAPMKR